MDLVGALLTTATAGAHPITDTAGEDHTTGMAAIGGTTPITILGDTHITAITTITTIITVGGTTEADVQPTLLYVLPTATDLIPGQPLLAAEMQVLLLPDEVRQV